MSRMIRMSTGSGRSKGILAAAAFEALEARQLLSGGSYQPLVIPCTGGNDTVLIKQQGDVLTVINNKVTSTYNVKSKTIPGPTAGSQIVIPGISKIVVDAGLGNDMILADDTVTVPLEAKGSAGTDLLSGGSADDSLWGGADLNSNPYEAGYDTLIGRGGNDKLYTPKWGGATFTGGTGNDTIVGGIMSNYVDAGSGNDTITTGDGKDTIHAGDGNDAIDTGNANDTVYGDAGNDSIVAKDGDDWVDAGAGNDTVDADNGTHDTLISSNDTVYGGDGFDKLMGGPGYDKLFGQAGWDNLDGGPGNDSIWGGDGWDTVTGGADADVVRGEAGNDLLLFSPGHDEFYGGPGQDMVDYRATSKPVTVHLDKSNNGTNGNGPKNQNDYIATDVEGAYGGSGNDVLDGSKDADVFYGMAGNDFIHGWGGDDALNGGEGKDTILGDSGRDNIHGNEGDDEVHGGADNDFLFGDAGDDLIVAIGGGTFDKVEGGANADSIWQDLEEGNADVSNYENAHGMLHRVPFFNNGATRDADYAKIVDPAFDSAAKGYANIHGNPLFNPNGIDGRDVNQAGVGDCGFVATLASIADKDPGRVEQAVVDLRDGTFAARVTVNGVPQYFRVDDDLPILKLGTKQLAYAQLGAAKSMWVPILEKVEATIRGGYGNCTGIWPSDAFKRFGYSTFDHWNGNNNGKDMLKDMAEYLDQGKQIVAWTGNHDWEYGDMIVHQHAYEVKDIDKVHGFVLLYNPWGTDAGGTADSWNDGTDDGLVWVSDQIFAKYFTNSTVAS